MTIESKHSIWKLSSRVFQIGEIVNIEKTFLNTFINILDLGYKFVPSQFNNLIHYKRFILSNFDNSLYNFNKSLFISKLSDKTHKEFNLDQGNSKNFDMIGEFRKSLNLKNRNNTAKSIPLQHDSLKFREEIYQKILNKNFTLKNNLDKNEINCLKYFKKEKPFKVTICDKNVGWCIINNNLYSSLGNEYLNSNPQFYTKLDHDPLNETIDKIKTKLIELNNFGHISNRLFKILTKKSESKIGKLSILPKLHKEKFNLRPIISNIDHPTSVISSLIDFILQPFVIKSETYIRDSQNLIQNADEIKVDKCFKQYSFDFESLYTNLDKIKVTIELTDFYSKEINHIDISAFAFKEFLTLIFSFNVFKFLEHFYIQINGISMGTKCGPCVANLYIYRLEKHWLVIERPLIYKRFIDDIYMLSNNFNLFNNFNH
jgi:hypothetical protein